MPTLFYTMFFALAIMLTGCATKTGAIADGNLVNSERMIVAVAVTNVGWQTADLYVAGSPAGSLLANESMTIQLKPTTHRPRVSAVASDGCEVQRGTRASSCAVRLSVRPIYERVPVVPF